jgi:hypothetical protein
MASSTNELVKSLSGFGLIINCFSIRAMNTKRNDFYKMMPNESGLEKGKVDIKGKIAILADYL